MSVRRVVALRAEYNVPACVAEWPESHQVQLLFALGEVYADLECGHSKRLYQKHYGETETCFECEEP